MMINHTKETIPVLIVGGGAAGVVLTAELRRRGIACRTIDKLPVASGYSRALTVHARTLEMFERLDRDLLNKFLSRGHPTHGFSFTFKGIEEKLFMDFRNLDTRYAYVLNHRQDESEQWIREYIRDNFDYEIEWNTRLQDFQQDDEGITVKLIHTDDNDRVEIIRAQWMVACDGIHSGIRKKLGLDYKGEDYTGMVLQNMDVPLENFPEENIDWLNFFMDKDHFILMAKLPGNNFRLLISDMGAATSPELTPGKAFQAYVDAHLTGVKLGEPEWASKWEIWNRLASNYRVGNIFLAGDSAHVHSPSGGQGMNCCMQDACNLAWKLALVIQGRARPRLLDSYEQERKPIAEQVIAGASAIHRIIMGHGISVKDRLRLAAVPGWTDQAAGRLSGISYTYRDYIEKAEDLSAIDGPAQGDRAPDVDFDDGSNLFALFRHPGMNLLLMPTDDSDGELGDCHRVIETVSQRYGDGLFKTCLFHSPRSGTQSTKFISINGKEQLAHRYGRSETGRLYMIRPDGYIGWRCLLSEAESFYQYLDTFLDHNP